MKTTIRRVTRRTASASAVQGLVRRAVGHRGLRCILYHEIADAPSAFTSGLSVTTSPDVLDDHLQMLARDYEFVSIDWLLAGSVATRTGRPPLLVTFDDAYASVASVAARICHRAGVPSVFFVNGAFVDNASLALDNLVAWVVNTTGMAPLAAATGRQFGDLGEFFGTYLPSISLQERTRVYDRLAEALPGSPGEVAADAALYVASSDVALLPARGMAVGNHTWSHVHCRRLDRESGESEIGRNKQFLESVVSRPVEAFSYPYGSRSDATDAVAEDLARSGHRAAFLVESHANSPGSDAMRLCRVSVGAVGTADLFTDLEILPLLRRFRDRIDRRR